VTSQQTSTFGILLWCLWNFIHNRPETNA